MKKFIKYLFLFLIIVSVSVVIYFIYLSPGDNFQSIYLVPESAAFIIETEKPFEAWNKIVHNQAWNYIKSNSLLKKINHDIEKADSVVNSNRVLLKLLGSRKIVISSHKYKPGKYDFLYVIDLKKASKLKSINSYINKIAGDKFRLTERNYKNEDILELYDKNSGDFYYFSFIRNKLIFSQVAGLIEASIDQLEELTLGRDINYTEVAKRTEGKGLFSICINYSYFDEYLISIMGKQNSFLKNLSDNLYYTSAYLDIDNNGLLRINGYTSLKDTVNSFFSALEKSGEGSQKIFEITSERTASVTHVGFSDINTLYNNFDNTLNDPARLNINSSIDKIEKRFKINIQENLFSWIDDEIALIQTQPSNLGRQNEFAVLFKAKSAKDAKENLDFLTDQLRKNSPVKFREMAYKNYTISYLHIPGVFKLVFGKLLERLEKPYFSIIDKWVVFSNHPQTIKSIIDDYEEGRTILKSTDKNTFISLFPGKSITFVYLQTPVLFNNLKEFVSAPTWTKMNENKKYIECFSDIGIQVKSEKELLNLEIIARFNPSFEKFIPVNYSSAQDFFYIEDSTAQLPSPETNSEPEIVINDLDVSKHEEFYDDGTLKLEVGLNKGQKHGIYKEYYNNGVLKIRGKYKNDLMDGTWKYYDEAGKLIDSKEYNNGIFER